MHKIQILVVCIIHCVLAQKTSANAPPSEEFKTAEWEKVLDKNPRAKERGFITPRMFKDHTGIKYMGRRLQLDYAEFCEAYWGANAGVDSVETSVGDKQVKSKENGPRIIRIIPNTAIRND
ncbi:uncharacterized protein LOC126841029 [Adelges cooleyi]|uniref:uncharacterized protein LOC126841029 n=1 Tax=Adelges cooleyi TaxID=133065 RepID=UPI00217FD060|nr:uncharacterized protein LOC126841029 [Adelges cooleyi]